MAIASNRIVIVLLFILILAYSTNAALKFKCAVKTENGVNVLANPISQLIQDDSPYYDEDLEETIPSKFNWVDCTSDTFKEASPLPDCPGQVTPDSRSPHRIIVKCFDDSSETAVPPSRCKLDPNSNGGSVSGIGVDDDALYHVHYLTCQNNIIPARIVCPTTSSDISSTLWTDPSSTECGTTALAGTNCVKEQTSLCVSTVLRIRVSPSWANTRVTWSHCDSTMVNTQLINNLDSPSEKQALKEKAFQAYQALDPQSTVVLKVSHDQCDYIHQCLQNDDPSQQNLSWTSAIDCRNLNTRTCPSTPQQASVHARCRGTVRGLSTTYTIPVSECTGRGTLPPQYSNPILTVGSVRTFYDTCSKITPLFKCSTTSITDFPNTLPTESCDQTNFALIPNGMTEDEKCVEKKYVYCVEAKEYLTGGHPDPNRLEHSSATLSSCNGIDTTQNFNAKQNAQISLASSLKVTSISGLDTCSYKLQCLRGQWSDSDQLDPSEFGECQDLAQERSCSANTNPIIFVECHKFSSITNEFVAISAQAGDCDDLTTSSGLGADKIASYISAKTLKTVAIPDRCTAPSEYVHYCSSPDGTSAGVCADDQFFGFDSSQTGQDACYNWRTVSCMEIPQFNEGTLSNNFKRITGSHISSSLCSGLPPNKGSVDLCSYNFKCGYSEDGTASSWVACSDLIKDNQIAVGLCSEQTGEDFVTVDCQGTREGNTYLTGVSRNKCNSDNGQGSQFLLKQDGNTSSTATTPATYFRKCQLPTQSFNWKCSPTEVVAGSLASGDCADTETMSPKSDSTCDYFLYTYCVASNKFKLDANGQEESVPHSHSDPSTGITQCDELSAPDGYQSGNSSPANGIKITYDSCSYGLYCQNLDNTSELSGFSPCPSTPAEFSCTSTNPNPQTKVECRVKNHLGQLNLGWTLPRTHDKCQHADGASWAGKTDPPTATCHHSTNEFVCHKIGESVTDENNHFECDKVLDESYFATPDACQAITSATCTQVTRVYSHGVSAGILQSSSWVETTLNLCSSSPLLLGASTKNTPQDLTITNSYTVTSPNRCTYEYFCYSPAHAVGGIADPKTSPVLSNTWQDLQDYHCDQITPYQSDQSTCDGVRDVYCAQTAGTQGSQSSVKLSLCSEADSAAFTDDEFTTITTEASKTSTVIIKDVCDYDWYCSPTDISGSSTPGSACVGRSSSQTDLCTFAPTPRFLYCATGNGRQETFEVCKDLPLPSSISPVDLTKLTGSSNGDFINSAAYTKVSFNEDMTPRLLTTGKCQIPPSPKLYCATSVASAVIDLTDTKVIGDQDSIATFGELASFYPFNEDLDLDQCKNAWSAPTSCDNFASKKTREVLCIKEGENGWYQFRPLSDCESDYIKLTERDETATQIDLEVIVLHEETSRVCTPAQVGLPIQHPEFCTFTQLYSCPNPWDASAELSTGCDIEGFIKAVLRKNATWVDTTLDLNDFTYTYVDPLCSWTTQFIASINIPQNPNDGTFIDIPTQINSRLNGTYPTYTQLPKVCGQKQTFTILCKHQYIDVNDVLRIHYAPLQQCFSQWVDWSLVPSHLPPDTPNLTTITAFSYTYTTDKPIACTKHCRSSPLELIDPEMVAPTPNTLVEDIAVGDITEEFYECDDTRSWSIPTTPTSCGQTVQSTQYQYLTVTDHLGNVYFEPLSLVESGITSTVFSRQRNITPVCAYYCKDKDGIPKSCSDSLGFKTNNNTECMTHFLRTSGCTATYTLPGLNYGTIPASPVTPRTVELDYSLCLTTAAIPPVNVKAMPNYESNASAGLSTITEKFSSDLTDRTVCEVAYQWSCTNSPTFTPNTGDVAPSTTCSTNGSVLEHDSEWSVPECKTSNAGMTTANRYPHCVRKNTSVGTNTSKTTYANVSECEKRIGLNLLDPVVTTRSVKCTSGFVCYSDALADINGADAHECYNNDTNIKFWASEIDDEFCTTTQTRAIRCIQEITDNTDPNAVIKQRKVAGPIGSCSLPDSNGYEWTDAEVSKLVIDSGDLISIQTITTKKSSCDVLCSTDRNKWYSCSDITPTTFQPTISYPGGDGCDVRVSYFTGYFLPICRPAVGHSLSLEDPATSTKCSTSTWVERHVENDHNPSNCVPTCGSECGVLNHSECNYFAQHDYFTLTHYPLSNLTSCAKSPKCSCNYVSDDLLLDFSQWDHSFTTTPQCGDIVTFTKHTDDWVCPKKLDDGVTEDFAACYAKWMPTDGLTSFKPTSLEISAKYQCVPNVDTCDAHKCGHGTCNASWSFQSLTIHSEEFADYTPSGAIATAAFWTPTTPQCNQDNIPFVKQACSCTSKCKIDPSTNKCEMTNARFVPTPNGMDTNCGSYTAEYTTECWNVAGLVPNDFSCSTKPTINAPDDGKRQVTFRGTCALPSDSDAVICKDSNGATIPCNTCGSTREIVVNKCYFTSIRPISTQLPGFAPIIDAPVDTAHCSVPTNIRPCSSVCVSRGLEQANPVGFGFTKHQLDAWLQNEDAACRQPPSTYCDASWDPATHHAIICYDGNYVRIPCENGLATIVEPIVSFDQQRCPTACYDKKVYSSFAAAIVAYNAGDLTAVDIQCDQNSFKPLMDNCIADYPLEHEMSCVINHNNQLAISSSTLCANHAEVSSLEKWVNPNFPQLCAHRFYCRDADNNLVPCGDIEPTLPSCPKQCIGDAPAVISVEVQCQYAPNKFALITSQDQYEQSVCWYENGEKLATPITQTCVPSVKCKTGFFCSTNADDFQFDTSTDLSPYLCDDLDFEARCYSAGPDGFMEQKCTTDLAPNTPLYNIRKVQCLSYDEDTMLLLDDALVKPSWCRDNSKAPTAFKQNNLCVNTEECVSIDNFGLVKNTALEFSNITFRWSYVGPKTNPGQLTIQWTYALSTDMTSSSLLWSDVVTVAAISGAVSWDIPQLNRGLTDKLFFRAILTNNSKNNTYYAQPLVVNLVDNCQTTSACFGSNLATPSCAMIIGIPLCQCIQPMNSTMFLQPATGDSFGPCERTQACEALAKTQCQNGGFLTYDSNSVTGSQCSSQCHCPDGQLTPDCSGECPVKCNSAHGQPNSSGCGCTYCWKGFVGDFCQNCATYSSISITEPSDDMIAAFSALSGSNLAAAKSVFVKNMLNYVFNATGYPSEYVSFSDNFSTYDPSTRTLTCVFEFQGKCASSTAFTLSQAELPDLSHATESWIAGVNIEDFKKSDAWKQARTTNSIVNISAVVNTPEEVIDCSIDTAHPSCIPEVEPVKKKNSDGKTIAIVLGVVCSVAGLLIIAAIVVLVLFCKKSQPSNHGSTPKEKSSVSGSASQKAKTPGSDHLELV